MLLPASVVLAEVIVQLLVNVPRVAPSDMYIRYGRCKTLPPNLWSTCYAASDAIARGYETNGNLGGPRVPGPVDAVPGSAWVTDITL